MKTSVHLLKLFVELSTLAELAVGRRKNGKQQRPKASRVSSRTPDAATQPSSFPYLARVTHAWRTDPRRWPAPDSGMRVRSSRDARRGLHRASTRGNVDSGYSASAHRSEHFQQRSENTLVPQPIPSPL